MSPGRRTGIAVLIGVVLFGTVAYGLVTVDRPRIQSVDTEWGTVTAERSEIETVITVANPLLLRVGDAAADVRYTVALNGIEVATERRRRVRLSGPRDVITVSTWIDNDEIPEWWVTHVNRNETTTVTVDPAVVLRYGGVESSADAWTRTRTFQTDLLAPLEIDRQRSISAFNRTALIVNQTDARWGHATPEQTPIHVSITVTNVLPLPLPITEIEYTIRMNGIVVGQGQAGHQTSIPAGTTRTLEAHAIIDNDKLDEWWVSHLRNDETTELTVEVDATVGNGSGERQPPLKFLSSNRTFRTQVFESGASRNNSDSRAIPTG